MRRAWTYALAGVALTVVAPSIYAHDSAVGEPVHERLSADEFLAGNARPVEGAVASRELKFEILQNPDYDPAYDKARNAMEPMYKGTVYARDSELKTNPFIGLLEIDLNRDDETEIIAQPVETEMEINLFCRYNTVCPYYILQKRGDKIHTLAVIWAETLDLGDDIKDGYWTLIAHTKKNPGDKPYGDYTETYVYNKKTDGYVKLPASSQPKP